MHLLGVTVGLLYFLGIVGGLILVIYLIFKRVHDKGNEKFEKRNN